MLATARGPTTDICKIDVDGKGTNPVRFDLLYAFSSIAACENFVSPGVLHNFDNNKEAEGRDEEEDEDEIKHEKSHSRQCHIRPSRTEHNANVQVLLMQRTEKSPPWYASHSSLERDSREHTTNQTFF